MTTSAAIRARTFSKSQAMIGGLLCALPFLVAVGCLFRFALRDRAQLMTLGGPAFTLAFLAIIAVSATLHELLHALGWMLAGGLRWRDVHFHLSAMMPTTSCERPLAKRAYLTGVLLPFAVLGLASLAFLVLSPGTLSLLAAFVNFTLAGADLLIAASVLREPRQARIADHPTLAGYIVQP